MRQFIITLVGLLIFLSPLSASADGVLNAVSYHPLVSNPAITVSPLDDSDENIRLKADFEKNLKAAGYQVVTDSSLVFTFETRGDAGSWGSGERRSVVEFSGHSGSGGKENQKTRLNIYNSERGGLLNKGKNSTDTGTAPLYRIDVSLDDRQAKNRIWQGWAIADLGHLERNELIKKMILVLTSNIGKTIRRQPFKIKFTDQ